MNVLVIRTSSLGDILHTLPAVSDAKLALPEARFTWVAEENFATVPTWHRDVERVLPVAMRRWRKQLAGSAWSEIRDIMGALRERRYDYVIDAQGLMKSALISRLARGRRFGYAHPGEKIAAWAYQRRIPVPARAHVAERARILFASSMGYSHEGDPDYGIDPAQFSWPNAVQADSPYVLFAHGTTRANKLWPEEYWRELCALTTRVGFRVLLPWANEEEKLRVQRVAGGNPDVVRLPRLRIDDLAAVLAGARGAVAVDTGLAHLCGALGTPCVSLWGSTDPKILGPRGPNQYPLQADFPCAPCMSRRCHFQGVSAVSPACFGTVPPDRVFGQLLRAINNART